MTTTAIVLLAFVALLFLGIPVAFVLGISSVFYCLVTEQLPFLYIVSHRMFGGIDNFVLMAIPLFMLAGEIMSRGDVSRRLVDLAEELVGRFRGGLGYVNVLASTFFAGITGSALSDIAAVGPIEIRMMEEAGYDTDFSAACTASSSLQGPLIPPSIPAVLLAAATGMSTGALFLAGAIPGLLIAVLSCLVIGVISRKRGYGGSSEPFSWKRLAKVTMNALLPLMTPAIILGGILFGVFTPTEAAVVAVVYSLLVAGLVYRKLTWRDLLECLRSAVAGSAKIYLIIGCANTFAWMLSMQNIPSQIASFLMNLDASKAVILLILNLFLLFWGMWMVTAPSIMILVPLLLPLVQKLGIHPVHFGEILVENLMIGLTTPPCQMALFATLAVSRATMKGLLRELLPFVIVDFVILGLITYVPDITMALPRALGLI